MTEEWYAFMPNGDFVEMVVTDDNISLNVLAEGWMLEVDEL